MSKLATRPYHHGLQGLPDADGLLQGDGALDLVGGVPDDEAKAALPDLGPAWPLGIGWLEDAGEPEAVPAPAPRQSLLTRLLSLLPWRR